MKKRLRKKLRRGEFQELGFNLEFDLTNFNNEVLFDNFLDSFIAEAIEANGLYCGGGGYNHFDYFVYKHKGSVSEEQRNVVKKWLENQPQVSGIVIGELRDA